MEYDEGVVWVFMTSLPNIIEIFFDLSKYRRNGEIFEILLNLLEPLFLLGSNHSTSFHVSSK